MGYLDSNYNASTHGAKGRYTPSEQKEINTEKEQSKNVVAEGNKKEQVSPEAAMGFLGAMAMQNQAIMKMAPKQVELSELNGAELEKAIDALTKKYFDEDAIARIEESMAKFAEKLEDNKNFALNEFPDLTENTAEALALSGMNAVV